MWVLTDRAMDRLLGGQFDTVVDIVKENNTLSIKKLFMLQNEYESYNGFRKFYNKYIKNIINELTHLEDHTLLAKIIKLVVK